VHALCLLTTRPLGLTTDRSRVEAGGSPPPLTHWELIAIDWTYMDYRLTDMQAAQ